MRANTAWIWSSARRNPHSADTWSLLIPRSDLGLGEYGELPLDKFASNEFQPDIVAITGDIVENPACVAWLPDTLGRLTARIRPG